MKTSKEKILIIDGLKKDIESLREELISLRKSIIPGLHINIKNKKLIIPTAHLIAYFPNTGNIMDYQYDQPIPEGEVEIYRIELEATKLQETELGKCDECQGTGVYYIDGKPQKCICLD